MQKGAHKQPVARRSTFAEGLYSGLVAGASAASDAQESGAGGGQREAKLQLLVEAPAAVEDALASLLNHVDPEVQVGKVRIPCSSCSVSHLYPSLSLSCIASCCWPVCVCLFT